MTIAQENRQAEVWIDAEVIRAAQAAAKARAQNLSEVCRVIVQHAAGHPANTGDLPVRREDGVDRRRMRFVVHRVTYAAAKNRVGSMSAYMEAALSRYSQTGLVTR